MKLNKHFGERDVHTFYLTDLVHTPTYLKIQKSIQSNYTRDANEEWPDAYYQELSQTMGELLREAITLNEPVGERQ